MGPLDNIGPYAETTITTRESDVEPETDNKPGILSLIIGVCILGPCICIFVFMGLYIWAHIGPITVCVVIGLGLWACGHYGTERSILDRFRYRTTKSQRTKMARRLSDTK